MPSPRTTRRPQAKLDESEEPYDQQSDEHPDEHSDEQSHRGSDWDSDLDAFHQAQSRGPPMVEDDHHDLSRLLAPENNVVYSGHFDHGLETSHIPARGIPNLLRMCILLKTRDQTR